MQRQLLAQRSVAILLRHCFEWLQHCSNIATLCCAKNRRCESSRVTSPLWHSSFFSLQWLPIFAVIFGLICGSGIYVCLYVDETLDLKIDLSRKDSEIPDYALIILKVVRYLAGCYVMSAFGLFWSFTVCVMHMTGFSMIEFHGM